MTTPLNVVLVLDAAIRSASSTDRPSRLEPPCRELIASLPPFEALVRERILLVDSKDAAKAALSAFESVSVVGFDTESKPTFVAGASRDGPHLIQLAINGRGFCFPAESKWARPVVERVLGSERILKVGFALSNDRKPLARRRRYGYRQRVGLRAAVAIVLGRQMVKSKKLQTSNWAARPLSPMQITYAANDAYASLKVFDALAITHPEWISHASGDVNANAVPSG